MIKKIAVNTIAVKSFQCMAAPEELLQKMVEAVTKGEREALTSGNVISFEPVMHGFRQLIALGRLYIVPPAVCDKKKEFPIALLYGTVVRELNLGEETADLISYKIGESPDWDEYSQVDFKELKTRLFTGDDGKLTSLVIFAPAWSNIRDYSCFKFTEDETQLKNLLRHLVFACYVRPSISSAFDALATNVDTTSWSVDNITPKLQYPFLSENPFKQYPELEKSASLEPKKAFLTIKTADELTQQELDPQELNVFESLDQAMLTAMMPEVESLQEAAGEFKAPGQVTTQPEGDRNNPDYGEEGSFTEEINKENEKIAGERHDDVPVALVPNVFQGGKGTKAEDSKVASLEPDDEYYGYSCAVCKSKDPFTRDPNGSLRCQVCHPTSPLEQDEKTAAGASNVPFAGQSPNTTCPNCSQPITTGQATTMSGAGGAEAHSKCPFTSQPAQKSFYGSTKEAGFFDKSIADRIGDYFQGPTDIPSLKALLAILDTAIEGRGVDPTQFKQGDALAHRTGFDKEWEEAKRDRDSAISLWRNVNHMIHKYGNKEAKLVADAEVIASILDEEDEPYEAQSTKAKKEVAAREAKLNKYRNAQRKIADVPLTEESIWDSLTEDFGEAPQVELKDESSGTPFSEETRAPAFESKEPETEATPEASKTEATPEASKTEAKSEKPYPEPKRDEPKSEGEKKEAPKADNKAPNFEKKEEPKSRMDKLNERTHPKEDKEESKKEEPKKEVTSSVGPADGNGEPGWVSGMDNHDKVMSPAERANNRYESVFNSTRDENDQNLYGDNKRLDYFNRKRTPPSEENSKEASWEDGQWLPNCPRPERTRCNEQDASCCCGGGCDEQGRGVDCDCLDCHPPTSGHGENPMETSAVGYHGASVEDDSKQAAAGDEFNEEIPIGGLDVLASLVMEEQ